MSDHELASAQFVVTTWGLPDAAGVPPTEPAVDVGSGAASRLLSWAVAERIDGLLYAALEGGALSLDAIACDRTADAHLRGLRMTLAAEMRAVESVDALAVAGVQSWALKGLAAAHLDYPDEAWRSFADADLLVRRADLPRALSVLVEAGHRRRPSAGRAKWEARYSRAVQLTAPDDGELDLHAAVAAGYFGARLDHERLCAGERATFSVAGADMPALTPAARLLVSCYALVLSRGRRTRFVRDAAQQLFGSGASWEECVDLAGRADGDAVISAALRIVAAELRLDTGHPALHWALHHRASANAERALALAAHGDEHGWAADARSTMLALDRRDAARFALGSVAAARSNRRAGVRTLRDQVRRARAVLRGGRSPRRRPSSPGGL